MSTSAADFSHIFVTYIMHESSFYVECSEDAAALVRSLYLLTMKPMIYAANVAEGDMADKGASCQYVQALKTKAEEDNCEVVVISAQVCSCFTPSWTVLFSRFMQS